MVGKEVVLLQQDNIMMYGLYATTNKSGSSQSRIYQASWIHLH